MKITAKSNFAGLEFNAITGQVLNLPDDIAQDLIQAGYAEATDVKTTKAEAKKAEAKDEDKRDNAGADPKPVARKRTSTKRR